MKRWQLFFLIFELMLLAAILVLPQVALPAFALHEGAGPVAAHARVCEGAAGAAMAVAAPILVPEPVVLGQGELPELSAPPAVHSRLSILCVLIC